MDKLISIIVPIYNSEKTLNKCIENLKSQTYKSIEIILVNDGSKDQSLQICMKHKMDDVRINVIDKQNGGVSSARNAGLDIAKGRFVMFCDSDDWPESQWCEKMISHYKQNCLIMCGSYIEGEQKYLPYEVKADNDNEWINRSEYYKLKLKNFNALWNKIFERNIIEKHHIRFNEELTNGEDYLFILQYLDKISGNILFMNECLYHYEWPNGQSLSNKVPDNYLWQCCFLSKEILTLAKKNGVLDETGVNQIKTDFFNEFQKLIISILYDENLSFLGKIEKVKSIMNTEEYIKCVKCATISPNKLYSLLYRNRNSLGLWFWHTIRK